MKRLLIVEDDRNLSDSLARYLSSEGYEVSAAATLQAAFTAYESLRAQGGLQAIVLDWMLPDGQGIDFLRRIRAQDARVPILLLTAKVDLVDKVVALEMGANDYLTKPFEPRELLARLRVQERLGECPPCATTVERPPADVRPAIRYRQITLDPDSRRVFKDGQEITLTKMEFELLHFFLQAPGRVFSREALLNRVWGYEDYQTTRTVDNHIGLLRQKLGNDLFETARGAGYRLAVSSDGGRA